MGADGPSGSSFMGHGGGNILSSSGKINSYSGVSTGANSSTGQYRGYSPSKPKWKANNMGMP